MWSWKKGAKIVMTENDLISRSALLEKFAGESIMLRQIRQFIHIAPAVDAVEVVRCKDCKHWLEDDDIGYCDNPDGLDNYDKPDDFCSYGERRTDNG